MYFRLQEVGLRPQDFLGLPITDFPRWEDRQITPRGSSSSSSRFPDLAELPPEIGG